MPDYGIQNEAFWSTWISGLSTSLMRKEMWEAIKDFEREDFHPEQRDTTALLDEWRERLFGDEGTLNDRLVGSTAV